MKCAKEKIISIIVKCAHAYKKELLNKNIIFVCMDKHKRVYFTQVLFEAGNFLHLTGCETNKTISAKEFFNKCLEKKISSRDFEISQDGTTEMKLIVLPFLISKNLSANMMGDFSGNNLNLYSEKIIGGVKACMGFVKKQNNFYAPNTVLNVDARKYIKKPMRIIATFRKNKSDKKYCEMVYKAKNINWDVLVFPKEIEYLKEFCKESGRINE